MNDKKIFLYPDTSFVRNILELIETYYILQNYNNKTPNDIIDVLRQKYENLNIQISTLEKELEKKGNDIVVIVHLKVYKEINMYLTRWQSIYKETFKKCLTYVKHKLMIPSKIVDNRLKIINELKKWNIGINCLLRITILFDSIFNLLSIIREKQNQNSHILKNAISEFVNDIIDLLSQGIFELNKYPFCSIFVEAENNKNIRKIIIKQLISCDEGNNKISKLYNDNDCLEDYHLSIAVCCLASLYKHYQKLNGGCSQAMKNNIIFILISSPNNGTDRKCFGPLNNQKILCNVKNYTKSTCQISTAYYYIRFFEPLYLKQYIDYINQGRKPYV